MKTMQSRVRAFTLVELLVVIGLIGMLAAGLGVAMRGNNPTASLRSAQGLLSSALAAARGQAALTQSDVEILVEAGSPADSGFLRRIIIVKKNDTAQLGPDILLPEGAYIVPDVDISDIDFIKSDGSSDWDEKIVSSFFDSTANRSINGATSKRYLLSSGQVSALGTIVGDGGKIVVAPGRLSSATKLEINSPEAARGVLVSRYGVTTIINEAKSFE